MDRLRIWIESRHSGSEDGPYINVYRPPPLRTSNTYDDDDTFSNVSLNLLSRYESLGLSATEAIVSTLISPKQRASFYDGLFVRLDRLSHLAPTMASIVHSINKVFGDQLRLLVEQESHDKCSNPYQKPIAPRQQQKKISRRFFPETGDSNCPKPTTAGGGTFFRNKKRIQNIDWTLAQAIQRVESLRLDGDEGGPSGSSSSSSSTVVTGGAAGTYQPPIHHPQNAFCSTKYS
jgi:hypothetical protein